MATQSEPSSSRPIELLLSRLEGVKRYGKGHRAPCPACGGNPAKLSVGETDNGAVILHCFGGCDAIKIVEAIGLSMGDLFPRRLGPLTDAERRQARERNLMAQWQAALEELCKEAAIVQIAQRQIARGQPLNEEDAKRLQRAEDIIANARNVLCPLPARFRPEVCRG